MRLRPLLKIQDPIIDTILAYVRSYDWLNLKCTCSPIPSKATSSFLIGRTMRTRRRTSYPSDCQSSSRVEEHGLLEGVEKKRWTLPSTNVAIVVAYKVRRSLWFYSISFSFLILTIKHIHGHRNARRLSPPEQGRGLRHAHIIETTTLPATAQSFLCVLRYLPPGDHVRDEVEVGVRCDPHPPQGERTGRRS